jgi:hypothetical protein
MAYRVAAVLMLLTSGAALAQQPTPLVPTADQPLPPAAAPPAETGPSRVFCGQTITYHLADPASLPEPYRPLIGLWSDASWTPQLCAALVVESVAQDGTATITYAFGPIGSGNQKQGGVLHGTGVVQDGELKFQNNDGSQYAFKPFYSDLVGHLTTAKGDIYEAIFKKTF